VARRMLITMRHGFIFLVGDSPVSFRPVSGETVPLALMKEKPLFP